MGVACGQRLMRLWGQRGEAGKEMKGPIKNCG